MDSLTIVMTVTNQKQNQKMTDYKNYSLSQLENWLHDAVSCNEISASEIYSTIKNVIKDEHDCYKKCADRCSDLLSMLGESNTISFNYQTDNFWGSNYESYNPYWQTMDSAGNDVSNLISNIEPNNWSIPVEVDDPSGMYYLTFPEDLINKLKWKENDKLQFTDNGDGSFSVKKV